MVLLKTLTIITFMSLVTSNIIVIDKYNPNINEYHCTPEESCTIGCLSSDSCSGTSLYCPSNHDCTIICDGRTNTATKTCFNSTIYALNSNKLSITITAHQSNAESMTIYTPYNNNNNNNIITCNSDIANHNQCKNINIYTNKGFNDIQLQCNDHTSLCHISGNMQCQYTNNNICNLFQYENNNIGYKCNDNQFCITNVIPPKIALFNTTAQNISNIITQNGDLNEFYVSNASPKSKDIHSLVLVIVGTVIICCVILILVSFCGVLCVKFNKETVEEILIKRYMSGRGVSLSNIKIFASNNDSNDCSNSNNSESSDTQTIEITETDTNTNTNTNQYLSEISTDKNSDVINIINNSRQISNEYNYNINQNEYENELDNIDNNINKCNENNHTINPLYNLSIQPIIEHSHEINSIEIIGENINNNPQNIYINDNINNDSEYIVMNEKHRQIHEQNIKNRHKCYGYSQPEILYEEDENYTDDSNTNNINEEKYIIFETNHNDSNESDISDDDELLEDGNVNTGDICRDDIQIKINDINTPLSVATSDIKDPEIISDDGHYPNLPPHAIIQYGNKLSVTGGNNVEFRL